MTAINVSTFEMTSGLRTLVARLAGLPEAVVRYSHENMPVATSFMRISFGPTLGAGRDTIKREVDANGKLVELTYGDRSVRFQLMYECRPQLERDPQAASVINAVVARLQTVANRQELRAAGLSIQSVGDVLTFPNFAKADRAVSRASVDVFCNATHIQPADPSEAVDVFNSVAVTASVAAGDQTVTIP